MTLRQTTNGGGEDSRQADSPEESEDAIAGLIRVLARMPGLGRRSAARVALRLLSDRRLLERVREALRRAEEEVLSCEICGNLCTNSPCRICSDPKRDKSVLCVVEGVDDILALERSQVYRGQYHVLGGTLSALEGRSPASLAFDSLKRRVLSANGAGTASESPASLNASPNANSTASLNASPNANPDANTNANSTASLNADPDASPNANSTASLNASLNANPDANTNANPTASLNANSNANLGRGEQKVREVILALSATVEGQTTAHYIADMLKASDCRLSVLGQGLPIGGSLNYLDDGTLFAAFRSRSEISPAPPAA